VKEGTNHAVFGRGAGVDVEVFTRPPGDAVREAIFRTAGAREVTRVVGVRVDHHVNADETTQLEAGVGARNVEETGTIQGADPHVLDRFGLDGKISCLSPTHGDQTR